PEGLPGAAAEVGGGFLQASVDAVEGGEDGQGHKGHPDVDEGDDHGAAAEEQDGCRFVDEAGEEQEGVEQAAGAQDEAPGKDAQQVAGPGGNDEQGEQEDAAAAGVEGKVVGQGVGQKGGNGGGDQGHEARIPQQAQK